MEDNRYYLRDDGWFRYFQNVTTGEKKLTLDKGDVVVADRPMDTEMFLALAKAYE